MRTLALACLATLSVSPATASQDAVVVKASLKKSKKNQVLVTVTLDIKAGWHTYLEAGREAASTITTVAFEVPAGVKKVGKLVRPFGQPYLADPGAQILEGRASFSQRFEVSASAEGAIKATVRYQACDDKRCMRPTSDTVSVMLSAASPSPFETPVRLMSGDKPLNVAARQMYPSPAIYDVDGDGRTELIVGDIFGTLNVYENENTTGEGDPVWSKHTALKNADGKKIKVSNW